MNWLYLQALVAGCSGRSCFDGEPSARSSMTPTGKLSCSRGRKTAISILSRSGRTFAISTGGRGVESWMSSLRASRASRSPLPGDSGELTTSGICGPKPSGSFAKWDRGTRCWRTYQGLLGAATLERFSGTWPKRGSMRSGACWARTMLVPRTGGNGSGLLPTPSASGYDSNQGGSDANDPRGYSRNGKIRYSLQGMARRGMWPTPRVSMANGPSRAEIAAGNPKGRLETAVMLPTPTSRDWKSGTGADHGSHSPPLSSAIGGQLNPTWVEWLMGFPLGWTDLQPLATDRFRRWLERHGCC